MATSALQIAEPAKLQVAQLSPIERKALNRFFSSGDAAASKPTENGMFIGRVGQRRVLWKRTPKGKPVVLSVLDGSYAPKK